MLRRNLWQYWGRLNIKQECLRESVAEGVEELEGEPKELEQVTVEDSEREFSEIAGQIGPMKEGTDGKDFREKLLTDDSLKTWKSLGQEEREVSSGRMSYY